MSDKQGTGFGLSRYWFDLTNLFTGGAGSFGEVVVPMGNVPSGTTDSGNPVKTGGYASTTAPTAVTAGQRANTWLGLNGQTAAMITNATGSAIAAVVGPGDAQAASTGLAVVSQSAVFNGATWDRLVKPNAVARLLSSAATTNATSAKAAAGNVHKIICNNTNAADRFLKIYNKASAPTVGTDTPVLTLTLPASTKNIQIDMGMMGQYFSAGIAYAITGLAADADTTAVGAGDITALNLIYS